MEVWRWGKKLQSPSTQAPENTQHSTPKLQAPISKHQGIRKYPILRAWSVDVLWCFQPVYSVKSEPLVGKMNRIIDEG
jgi:hypothetical protein